MQISNNLSSLNLYVEWSFYKPIKIIILFLFYGWGVECLQLSLGFYGYSLKAAIMILMIMH